jgi:hypothetical protein
MTITPDRLLTWQARAPFHKGASALLKMTSLISRPHRKEQRNDHYLRAL